MSRGGRFGGRKNEPAFLKEWELGPGQKLETKPSELFPPVPDLPTSRSLTRAEYRIVQNAKALRNAIHQGPLYTESRKPDPFQSKGIYDDEQRNAQYSAVSRAKADVDPFEDGVPTYSVKYSRPKRTIPQLSGRPFNKELFPPELHDTLQGKSSTSRKTANKKLVLAMTPAQQAAEELRRKQALENIQKFRDDEEEEDKAKEDEEEAVEDEEQDDGFDDEEYEMEGDYDAEQYFDGGEGDDDDMDGGGGDDY